MGPPTPSPASVCFPLWTQRGEEQHSLAGEGVGGPNSDDWKESLALCLLYCILASCVSDVLYNVKYSLEGGSLQLELSGAVTAPTPVNLVNHVYFNLAGHKAGADGTLWRNMHIYIYVPETNIISLRNCC